MSNDEHNPRGRPKEIPWFELPTSEAARLVIENKALSDKLQVLMHEIAALRPVYDATVSAGVVRSPQLERAIYNAQQYLGAPICPDTAPEAYRLMVLKYVDWAGEHHCYLTDVLKFFHTDRYQIKWWRQQAAGVHGNKKPGNALLRAPRRQNTIRDPRLRKLLDGAPAASALPAEERQTDKGPARLPRGTVDNRPPPKTVEELIFRGSRFREIDAELEGEE